MTETITALATALGQGGIGIIRISGSEAYNIMLRLFKPYKKLTEFKSHMLYHGEICNSKGERLDDGLAVFMAGPNSFTGEDVVEFQGHGSPVLLGLILESICECGARLAERGEFTKRAFLNKKIDLSQAEAIAELISAPNKTALNFANSRLSGQLLVKIEELQHKIDELRALLCLAVDFPDDEVDQVLSHEQFLVSLDEIINNIELLLQNYKRTQIYNTGLTVALAGPVNVGKSSLLNALLGRQRALVSASPGTTRDYLEEVVNLDGINAKFIDTAGIRDGADIIEAEGIDLGRKIISEADIVLLMIDGANPDFEQVKKIYLEFQELPMILVWNKIDISELAPWINDEIFNKAQKISISANKGEGLEELTASIKKMVLESNNEPSADLLVPNIRQAEALRKAKLELVELIQELEAFTPWDLCSVRLESAHYLLSDVIGVSTADEVLNNIFATFCIGK